MAGSELPSTSSGSGSQETVTRTLRDMADARLSLRDGLDRLYPVVYADLRRLARALVRRDGEGTLNATSLVHEAYLRLVGLDRIDATSRAQFFGLAARAMRTILVDHARRRIARKRGRGWRRVALDERIVDLAPTGLDVLDLHAALRKLAHSDARAAQVVEMRVFAGLTIPEVAAALGVSPRTIDNEWRVARAWLHDRISRRDLA